MTGPTGLIFAMRSRFTSQSGTEALFDEENTDFSSRNGNVIQLVILVVLKLHKLLLNDDPSTKHTRGSRYGNWYCG